MKQNHPKNFRVLFLSKKDNEFAQRAACFIKQHFPESLIFAGERKDKLPPEVLKWQGDLLVSFISSWVLPQSLLTQAAYVAINFHPGSPEYPGTGCTNFAIYDGATEYGVTCHYMSAGVDSGSIIAVKRFPIKKEDTVYSVTRHCYQLIEEMFYELMNLVLQELPLPASSEKWGRKPTTRKELDELCHISPDMSPEEIERRIKATTYKTPWAYTKIGNHVFKLQS